MGVAKEKDSMKGRNAFHAVFLYAEIQSQKYGSLGNGKINF